MNQREADISERQRVEVDESFVRPVVTFKLRCASILRGILVAFEVSSERASSLGGSARGRLTGREAMLFGAVDSGRMEC